MTDREDMRQAAHPQPPATPAPDSGTGSRNSGRRMVFLGGQIIVGTVVVYYIYRTLAGLIAAGGFAELRFDWPLMAASVAAFTLYNLMFVHSSQLVLRAVGERASFSSAFQLNYVSSLGKYLPGGIWHVVGRFALADALGVRKRGVVVMTVFENALGVVSGIVVGIVGLGLSAADAFGLPVWLPPVVGAASLVALHPAIFGRMMAFGLKHMGADEQMPHLSFGTTLALVAYRCVGWLVAGIGFSWYTRALTPDPAGGLGLFAGAIAAASVFGLLVIFVPGGIGVREASLTALLTPTLGPVVAGTVGLTSRVWTTVVELGLSAVAVALSARVRVRGGEAS